MRLDELIQLTRATISSASPEDVVLLKQELIDRGVREVAIDGRPPLNLELERPRRFGLLNLKIDDHASALRAAREGAVAAWLVAGFTAMFAALSMTDYAIAGLGVNTWSFIDAALMVAIGMGIWRGSSIASVLGVLCYLAGQVIMWAKTGRLPGGIALLILLALINGVRGTRALRVYPGTSPM